MVPTFKLKYFGKILNGKFVLQKPELFRSKVRALEGKEVELTLEIRERIRSGQWNKYYWKVPVAITSDETGNSPDQVHEGFKKKYLPHIIRCKEDGERLILDTTTMLTNKEFKQYIRLIISGEAEDGISIPEPNEIDFE